MTGADEQSSNRHEQLRAGLTDVTERVERACASAGRVPDEVTILPITKFFPASDVAILADLGCTAVGENKVQEAERKIAELGERGRSLDWHMVGRLQRNKAAAVGRWAAAVHSVDNHRLLDPLARGAREALDADDWAAPVRVLLQVSLDGDPHRGGVDPPDMPELADAVARLPELRLAGVMAVAPLDSDADEAFDRLRQVHEQLMVDHPEARERSAGMTGDLEAAIRHGSTCVRVGTAILGKRPITSEVNSRNSGNSASTGGARESGPTDERKVDR